MGGVRRGEADGERGVDGAREMAGAEGGEQELEGCHGAAEVVQERLQEKCEEGVAGGDIGA